MRASLLFILSITTLISCSKSDDFTVSGTVEGLKKGTLYLQTIQNNRIVSLDSIIINGNPDFKFTTSLKEPQALYLYLDKKDASVYDDRISFFAEPGEMSVTTSLKGFDKQASITGSKNHEKWIEFETINKQFNIVNINLIKNSLDAKKYGDQETVLKYNDSIKTLQLRRYRYIGNFAITNKELSIAPYIVVTQMPDASASYLDTIYKSFPIKIQQSIYGKQLVQILQSRAVN